MAEVAGQASSTYIHSWRCCPARDGTLNSQGL